ncbi:helix-turn-helix transcriptional regulator [Asticcacaulis machinosus]|uniref:Helix-turn-helix domain-containing protein n=1 Tax=Asticcacaulis machinosus TaxID=2984211 RepID=A0ABT5HGX7_9CAUL|nr:helix-turn-helix domain-containing protein [Asticcacaulis machinosus]MDC7675515.1 helix-turn-helix domain-containing protein [Asticcacaulis machinosus]
MAAPLPPIPKDRLLRTPEAARYLGLSDRTLEKHRCYGTGPVYIKLGGRVVYDMADLQAWARSGSRTHTRGERLHSIGAPTGPVNPLNRTTSGDT